MRRALLLTAIMMTLPLGREVMAQYVEPQPSDYYNRTMTWEQLPQKMEFVRESDVYWSKVLWGIIDVREKENQYFYFPTQPEGIRGRKNLAYVIWDAILANEIEVFEDDEMRIPLDNDIIIAKATRSDTVQMEVYDDYGEMDYETVLVPNQFTSENIYQYATKIGLAPMEEQYKVIDGDMEYTGTRPLFWIPMLSWNVKVLFAKKEAYCRENLVHLPTWEYAFKRNMYTWFITREDNVYNRAIMDYLTGEDALLEAQRIEEEILNISLDMWEY